MIVPNNEGKVCDAVVRALEKWTDERRADIRHPDKDEVGPPVDLRLKLGTQEYAIEHTRIESHENQIGTVAVVKRIICHIKKNIPDPFPSPAYYELQFPIDVSLPKGKAKRDRALNNLVEWIRANEQILRDRNAGCFLPVGNPYMYIANDYIRGTPAGFDCEFDLLHWQVVRLIQRIPGKLSFRFILPDDLEGPRAHRLRQAFSRKCPKLQACKTEEARTILVLESSDSDFMNLEFRGKLLPSLLTEYTNAPDEIFLVETCFDSWWVWLIKRDDDHWPTTGMPELDRSYYDPDKSPLPGIPEWLASIPKGMRDAFQLDSMDTPYLPGWSPAIFEKDKLDDLTAGRTARRS